MVAEMMSEIRISFWSGKAGHFAKVGGGALAWRAGSREAMAVSLLPRKRPPLSLGVGNWEAVGKDLILSFVELRLT